MIVFLCILYVLIAAFSVFAINIAAVRICDFSPDYDSPWPTICGIFWPVCVPFVIAYMAAKWYLDNIA